MDLYERGQQDAADWGHVYLFPSCQVLLDLYLLTM